MADEQKTQEQKRAKLDELVRDIRIAMFTTADPNGRLYSRPMYLQEGLDDEGCLNFFADRHSAKIDELRSDAQVNCAFAKPGDQEYVSASGTATVSQDRALIRRKWSAAAKAWYPDGPDSPELCLIRVKVSDAQYWDARNGTVLQVYGTIKAVLTGQRVKDAGENEKVSL